MLSIFLQEEVLGEDVDSLDLELPSERVNGTVGLNLVAGEVIISNKVLTWLVDSEVIGQFLSLQEESEGVPSIVSIVHFPNLNGIVR